MLVMPDSVREDIPVCGTGSADGDLSDTDLRSIVEEGLAFLPRDARVLAIIPDKTRDDNTHLLFPVAAEILAARDGAKLDALVAQGTHSAMSDAEKLAKIGGDKNKMANLGTIHDHRWDRAEELVTIGELPATEVEELTGGLFSDPIPLQLNHLAATGVYDTILIFGATVPHEVAGFAGGAKYFFPGISGPELTHKTHWLAALATIEKIIGRVETPTRHMIEAAADRVDARVINFTPVVSRTDDDRLRTHALFGGDFRISLRKAAEISRQVHIKYTGRKYRRVVALLDEHYEDLWLGGKASYRLGAVIEEGGELIIYAPRLHCISETHGRDIERFGGYAPIEVVKDLVAQSGELQANLCVAAHLAHVSYAGKRDVAGGFVTKYRITLASQVDREMCERVNLSFMALSDFDLADYSGDPDTLIVHRAGRDLYLERPFDD
jgi:nickel-dependent lactate racemase